MPTQNNNLSNLQPNDQNKYLYSFIHLLLLDTSLFLQTMATLSWCVYISFFYNIFLHMSQLSDRERMGRCDPRETTDKFYVMWYRTVCFCVNGHELGYFLRKRIII